MLVIKAEQFDAFKASQKKELVEQLVYFLKENNPAWSSEKGDEKISAYVEELVSFSWESNVFDADNVKRLLLARIQYNFSLTHKGYAKEQLARDSFAEKHRVDEFISFLASGKGLTKITLDTDLGG